MSAAIEVLSLLCLAAGAFFCLVGGIGLVRMPDFFTRVHAASVTETLGAGLLLLGLILKAGLTLVSVKLAIIGILIYFASPTASHALAKAALIAGIKPVLADPVADQPDADEVTSSKR